MSVCYDFIVKTECPDKLESFLCGSSYRHYFTKRVIEPFRAPIKQIKKGFFSGLFGHKQETLAADEEHGEPEAQIRHSRPLGADETVIVMPDGRVTIDLHHYGRKPTSESDKNWHYISTTLTSHDQSHIIFARELESVFDLVCYGTGVDADPYEEHFYPLDVMTT